jgi:zinc protease
MIVRRVSAQKGYRALLTIFTSLGVILGLTQCSDQSMKSTKASATSTASSKTRNTITKKQDLLPPSPAANAERVVLPNGLTIITCEDHSAPVSSVQVWAKTGSIHENEQLGAGLSHILEHMLFKGTEKRGVADISRQVEAYGGYINAYTTWDRTVYYIDIPSEGGRPGTSEGTEMAIDILADAMMNSTLPANEYLLEQKVILREMAMGRDNPDRQASQLFFSTIYSTHPAQHPVIGYEDVYKALTREDVMKYYKERYVPNNLVFVVTGDIDSKKVREQITKLMGHYPRKALPNFFVPDEPPQVTPRVVVNESRTAAEQARIYIGYPTVDFRHEDAAALEILSLVAGSGMSSRLYQNLREKQDLVHEIDAWSYTPDWRGIVGVHAVADPDKVDRAREAILVELEKFKKTLISSSELEKALKIALSNHLSSRKTMSGIAGELGGNELLTGDLGFSDKYLLLLNKVTPADVQRVAQKYLVAGKINDVTLLPKGTLTRKDRQLDSQEEQPIVKTILDNKLTLLTKPENRLPFVELRLVMKSGLLFESAEKNGISQLTSKLLLKGTKKRSAEQIVSQLESVGGSISTYSGANSMGVSIEVMQTDLPLALEILSDIVRNSTFSEEAINREKQAQYAEIRQEKEQPVRVAMQNAKKLMFGSHPYNMPNLGTLESVKGISRNDILDFWKKTAVPSNMVLAVFGDIADAKPLQLVEKHLGSLDGAPFHPPAIPAPAFGKEQRTVEQQDKEQSVIVIGFPGVGINNPDRASLELMNSALSGMGSRLFYRLRDQLALCYYVGVNQMVGLDTGFIYFYIGTEPEKAKLAEKEILSEIAKLKKDGITKEELGRAKNSLLGERKMQKQNLGDLALASALDELYGLGYDFSDKLESAYQSADAAQIEKVAHEYLSKASVTSVVEPKPAEIETPKAASSRKPAPVPAPAKAAKK